MLIRRSGAHKKLHSHRIPDFFEIPLYRAQRIHSNDKAKTILHKPNVLQLSPINYLKMCHNRPEIYIKPLLKNTINLRTCRNHKNFHQSIIKSFIGFSYKTFWNLQKRTVF